MAILKGYPEGSDISILDCRYRYPSKNPETGKWGKDWMYVIFKDNKTGRKTHQIIENPEYEYFMAKDTVPLDHNLFFIEKEKVDPICVPFKDLLKDIAARHGDLDFYYDNIRNGNRSANMLLHTKFDVFNSDMHIEDHYRFRFNKQYTNAPITPLSKAYFDIEADTINMMGDFPELGECPINAVSYILDNKVTVFLLRNPDNPLIEEFEKSIGPDLFKELQDFIIQNAGGEKLAKKYGIDNLIFDMIFYDDEVKLIQDLFMLVNQDEPDFLLAWNMAFDVPYIIERLKKLGIPPEEILCHPSFDRAHRVAEYYIDERHKNEYEARGDKYDISSHTVFLDQLIHFASRRKGQTKFPSFKLDDIGGIIAKVRKLDYSHITTDIAKLPYLDYKTFVFYNIMDTIVQKCIETIAQDVNYIYMKCLTNNTRYDKGHRQTVYLTNRATKDFDEEGFIICNNLNRNAQKVAIEGALVGDPTHNSDYSKMKLYDQILNLALNLLDFDYKSLYPSCALQDNMSPNTIIGKIEIKNKVFKEENPFNKVQEGFTKKTDEDAENIRIYLRGGQYVEDLISENVIEFCYRWLHYANFRQWLEDFNYYFTHIEYPYHVMNPRNLFDHVGVNKMRLLSHLREGEETRLFTYIPERLDYHGYLIKMNSGGK